MRNLAPIRKALVAFVGSEAAALGASMLDGNLTASEAITSTGLALVTAFAAWRVPNSGR